MNFCTKTLIQIKKTQQYKNLNKKYKKSTLKKQVLCTLLNDKNSIDKKQKSVKKIRFQEPKSVKKEQKSVKKIRFQVTPNKKKKIQFQNTPEIKYISLLKPEEKKEKKEYLKKVLANKKINRKIAHILYRKIPPLKDFLKYYMDEDKKPLYIIRDPEIDKHKSHKLKINKNLTIKYSLTTYISKGYISVRVNNKKIKIKFNTLRKNSLEAAEYKAKVWIIKETRKIFRKEKIY